MDVNCEWPFPPDDLRLSGNEAHVWCACLKQFETQVEQLTQILSIGELERAERFHFMQHRNQFIVTHGLLRKLLADYTHIEAAGITFGYGRNGKPFLSKQNSGEKIWFNLSHSNGYGLFAFAYYKEIGVDIEYISNIAEMERIAENFFSANEKAVLSSLPIAEKKEAFFTIWTRKESMLKASGEGLSTAIETIDTSLHPDNAPVFVDEDGRFKDKKQWYVQDLKPVPGFAAAFAVEGAKVRLRCWRIPKNKGQVLYA